MTFESGDFLLDFFKPAILWPSFQLICSVFGTQSFRKHCAYCMSNLRIWCHCLLFDVQTTKDKKGQRSAKAATIVTEDYSRLRSGWMHHCGLKNDESFNSIFLKLLRGVHSVEASWSICYSVFVVVNVGSVHSYICFASDKTQSSPYTFPEPFDRLVLLELDDESVGALQSHQLLLCLCERAKLEDYVSYALLWIVL